MSIRFAATIPLLLLAISVGAQSAPVVSAEASTPEAISPAGASPDLEAIYSPMATGPSPRLDQPRLVYRFDLHDSMIDSATEFYFARAYTQAEAVGADAIIIDIDTPGGSVASCLNIRNRIFDSDIPTYAYVRSAISAGALIALAADRMYISERGTIGAAQVITGTGGELPPAVNEKFSSFLRAEVRSLIVAQSEREPDRWTDEEEEYQIRLAEAFITPPSEDIVSIYTSGEIVCHAERLLTMDFRQAVAEHMAESRCDTFDEVLVEIGMPDAVVREVVLSWSEKLARFLSSTAVSSLLLLVGLAGLYLEFKAPGFGLPGIIGLSALGLYFFGAYVADLSTIIEPLLVIIGFALLAVEIFILPGFGVAGIAGIACIIGGLLMALVKLPPPEFGMSPIYFSNALFTVALGLVLMFIAAILLARILPKTSIWRHLELAPAPIGSETAAMPAGVPESEVLRLPGKTGRARTDLRPSGIVDIGGNPFDVVTEGEYITAGTPVRVLVVSGKRIVVAATSEPATPGS